MTNFIRAVPGLHKSAIYTDDSGESFRFSRGSRAWRYHNPGNIRSSKAKKGNKINAYYIEPKEWLTKSECIDLAKQGKVELEVGIGKSKTSYLRTPPNSLFQKCLHLIVEKLSKIKKQTK